jgi:hypothetical protein
MCPPPAPEAAPPMSGSSVATSKSRPSTCSARTLCCWPAPTATHGDGLRKRSARRGLRSLSLPLERTGISATPTAPGTKLTASTQTVRCWFDRTAMSRGAAVHALRILRKSCARRWIVYSAGCPQLRDGECCAGWLASIADWHRAERPLRATNRTSGNIRDPVATRGRNGHGADSPFRSSLTQPATPIGSHHQLS